ncbi:DUF4097 family beta strand repeat-containing protein [Roseivirga sp. E12]|uniref:DUF4097 family beta strand repeat-containing protein n=1 Tax=Roseivirga sp. E12 TaxID=2819237 RepID=UPI001ABCB5DC|nr:DUF4097 family beta strand repeat-containing protein [Roseivirga sp. E12]MBO3698125.1 DUF4097 family beta strand repeat protein [Roseivirga sp. E12]
MQKLKPTLFIVLFLLAVTTAYAQETIEKTYTGIKSIRLTTASGNGTIKKSNTAEVKVHLRYTYDEDVYEPSFEQKGDRLYIDEDFKRSRWTKGYSEWTLEVPDGIELDFKTGSGNIEVSGVNIEVRSSTGSGNIDIEEVNGEIRANTGSGNITFDQVEGQLDANTGSGSIRLDRTKGDADLNTGSGNIRSRGIEGELSMNTGSGNIDVTDAVITGSSTFNTGSGTAEVSLAGPLDHDLSVNTGSGNAILDFNGQDIAGEFVMGASDKDDIRAPFRFDKEYEDDRNRSYSRRGRRNGWVKEAKVGNKDILIKISSGSGRAVVKG